MNLVVRNQSQSCHLFNIIVRDILGARREQIRLVSLASDSRGHQPMLFQWAGAPASLCFTVLQIILSEVATKEIKFWQLESRVAAIVNGIEDITPDIIWCP